MINLMSRKKTLSFQVKDCKKDETDVDRIIPYTYSLYLFML